MFTWPGALLLAQHLWETRSELCGVRIVELGSGTALAGLTAARAGAIVTLTDRNQPKILDNIRASVRKNSIQASVLPLEWGKVSCELLSFQKDPPKIIIGSDCLYEPKGTVYEPKGTVYAVCVA